MNKNYQIIYEMDSHEEGVITVPTKVEAEDTAHLLREDGFNVRVEEVRE